MNHEAALISRAVIGKEMKEVIDLRLQDELFVHHKSEWEFISRFYLDHGDSPPPAQFEKLYPNFELQLFDAPLSFIVEELRKRRMHNLATGAIQSSAKFLKSKDPAAAIDSLREAVLAAEVETRPSRDVNLAERPLDRLVTYDELAEMGGITGLPSPWDVLDEVTTGFNDEELIMIVARGGVGKTWMEVILSRFLWAKGHVPLVFTKEMSVAQMARRFDGVNAGLPYQRFRSGQLTYEERLRYEATLKAMDEGLPYWVSGDDEGSGGVSGIAAKIDRYKPRAAFLDGMYLVEDDRKGDSGWQRLGNVAWDLKQIARKKKIPFIVTHQFNKEAKEDKGTADDLAYGDVQKWCDLIIGMYQTEDLRLNKEMLFRILKQREGQRLEFVASWDLENMVFEVKEAGADDLGEPGSTFQDGDTVPF